MTRSQLATLGPGSSSVAPTTSGLYFTMSGTADDCLETLVSQMHRRIYVLKCEGPIFRREGVESGEIFFVLDLGGVTQPLVYF